MIEKISKKKCLLGEGLLVKNSKIYWLDIKKKKVFCNINNFELKLQATPSVILEKKNHLIVGTNKGIFFIKNKKLKKNISFNNLIDVKKFRLNDGCSLGKEKYLVGTMPLKHNSLFGTVYLIEKKKIFDLNLKIKIPNTFIRINKNTFLISDSFCQKVYKVKISLQKKTILSKKTVIKFNNKNTPDGGCLVPNGKIVLSMWNGSSVKIFNKDYTLYKTVKVPVKNPTNCKYDNLKDKLIVTSASLNSKKNDLSGHTFAIKKFSCYFL
jgi:sugar lactone lactonase YvrE